MILTHLVILSFFEGASASEVVAPAAPVGSVLLPSGPNSPGPAPKLGDRLAGREASRTFAGLGFMEEVEAYINDVHQWLSEVEASGDEPVDVFASEIDGDEDLFGARGHRKAWRGRGR